MSQGTSGGAGADEPAARTPAPGKRRPLSAKKKLLFGLVACLGLLGVAEVAFAIRETVRSKRKPRLPRTQDDYRGLINTPGAKHERRDKGQTIHINALGMRSPEVGEKQPGVPRIVAIGGSTTYGLYTSSNDKTWPAQLQVALAQAGHTTEVLNAGAPAWTLRVSLTNLELTVWATKPDVVIMYHNYNDLMSNQEPVYWADSKVDDVEELKRPQHKPLLEHSALFRFIRSRLRDPRDSFLKKTDALSDEGAQAFERNLRRLVRRCKEQDVKLLLCTYPTAYRKTYAQSVADKVPAVKDWYEALCPLTYPKLLEGLDRYNAIIRKVAAEATLPVAELATTFPKDVSYYASPLHHSDKGEAEVAKIVAEALRSSGLLGSK